MPPNSDIASPSNAQRVMAICNACRYCEGYCAVFPAMERRSVFEAKDLHYLANLCHNCAECYYACPYTPPHEFAVNVPKLLAEIRAESYREYSWPHWYGGTALATLALCLTVFFWGAQSGTSFYDVISHSAMVAIFGGAALFVLSMLGGGVTRFWREIGPSTGPQPISRALRDAVTLRYLSGDQPGAKARRWFHHFTFYGFLLCFCSTTAAAVDHYLLGLSAPYPILSLPVILGIFGGIGLLIGPAGLYAVKQKRNPAISDPRQDGTDVAFLALLFLAAFTGLLLLALRDTGEMSLLLRIHLAIVLALFLTMPYGKFVHGAYRFAALLRYAFETASSTPRKDR